MAEFGGRKGREEFLVTAGPGDIKLQRNCLVASQPIENSWNGSWYSCAHQNVINPGEHRPEETGKDRQLDFFQQVDADNAAVTFFGKEYLDKAGQHIKPKIIRSGISIWGRSVAEGFIPLFSSRNEEICENLSRYIKKGKRSDSSPEVALEVSALEPSCENQVQRSAGNDAQLTDS